MKGSVVLRLQYVKPGFPFVASVVVTHITFALLEKTRIDNFQETGEV